MLTSLFGDLHLPSTPGSTTRPPRTIESDGAFSAVSVVARTHADVNDRGEMVDRHVHDLFVTGSPAQAMREHFATSAFDSEGTAKRIALFDPSLVWAPALIKALSDAGAQPIERLLLREQGTLRTLATIERTCVVRRYDDWLKVYHADVRASGAENAEISTALMERSHMTAVIVGAMTPQALDAMLADLLAAIGAPTWHCPALLFMLPPGAAWVAGKIAGIDWPQEKVRVQVLSESLSSTSAVWNALLGIWTHFKTQPAPGAPASADVPGELALADVQIKVADLSPPEPTVDPAAPDTASRPDLDQARDVLGELFRTDGLIGCALVDSASGLALTHEQRDGASLDFDTAAAAASRVWRAHRLEACAMGLDEQVEELTGTAGQRHYITRKVSHHPQCFVLALFERNRTNLALARFRLLEVEKKLI